MYREIRDGKIKCRDCREWTPIIDFQHHTGPDGKRRAGSYCKRCNKLRKEKDMAKARYGLSRAALTELINTYPVCAICGASKPFIDHDHKTGKVRGRLWSKL